MLLDRNGRLETLRLPKDLTASAGAPMAMPRAATSPAAGLAARRHQRERHAPHGYRAAGAARPRGASRRVSRDPGSRSRDVRSAAVSSPATSSPTSTEPCSTMRARAFRSSNPSANPRKRTSRCCATASRKSSSSIRRNCKTSRRTASETPEGGPERPPPRVAPCASAPRRVVCCDLGLLRRRRVVRPAADPIHGELPRSRHSHGDRAGSAGHRPTDHHRPARARAADGASRTRR